jgi:hypothetical protein
VRRAGRGGDTEGAGALPPWGPGRRAALLATAGALALSALAAGCGCRPRVPGLPDEDDAPRVPGVPPRPPASVPGTPRVWAVPESVRVLPDATVERCGGPSPFAARFPDYRNRNPVWDAAARRLRLEAARGETVAAHLLVDAPGAPLAGVTVAATVPGARVIVSREALVRVARRSANEQGPIPGVCAPGDVPDPLLPLGPGERFAVTRLGAVAPSPHNRGAGALFATGAYTGRGHRSYLVEVRPGGRLRVSSDGGASFAPERPAGPGPIPVGDGVSLELQPPTRKVAAGPAFAPGDRFRFAAYDEATQGLYLEVAVPRDAPPGVLRGEATVAAAGLAPARVAVEVTVRDVVLPPTPALLLVWRLYSDDIAIGHGLEGAPAQERFAVVREYLRAARDHGAEAVVRGVDPTEDPATFARTYGTLLDGSAFADHRPPRLFEVYADPPAPGAAEGPFVTRLRAAAAELARRGYQGRAFVYPVDEPSLCDFGRVAHLAALVARGAGTRLAVLLTAPPFPLDPVDSQYSRTVRWRCGPDLRTQVRRAAGPALPLIWAVPAQYYFPAASNPGSRWAIDAVRRDRGVAWFYQDHEPWVGGVRLDAEALGPRTWGWVAYRYAVDGAFYYAATHWEAASHGHRNPRAIAQVALTYRGRQSAYNGDGELFYPGPAFGRRGPVLSLRAKAFRRGVFDHELLTLLGRRDPAAAAARAAALVPRALNVFVPGSDHAVPTWRRRPGRGAWSHDPVAYDEAASALRQTLAARASSPLR